MGALSVIGFKIKPQTVIVIVAVTLTELFFHRLDRARVLVLGKHLLCFVLAALITLTGINAAIGAVTQHTLTDEMKAEKEFPFTHFLMMGLNPETGGFFSSEDGGATASFSTKQEKIDYNLTVIRQRLSALGPVGYLQFLLQKGRANFHGIYMDMWVRSPFPNTDPLSTALQGSFCQGGQGFRVYQQFLEALWVILLLLWLLPVVFCPRSCGDRFGTVLRLAVMGFALFLLLFEGGPRYRFHQFPIFILLAVWGMQVLPDGLRNSWARTFGRRKNASAQANRLSNCTQKEAEPDV